MDQLPPILPRNPGSPSGSSSGSSRTCTPSCNYVAASKPVPKAIGAIATIKTVCGKFCCEPNAISNAHQAAYVSANNLGTGGIRWAQTGWAKCRNVVSTTIAEHRYAEINGDKYNPKYDATNPPPSDRSSHTYQCDFTTATGTWAYSCDGAQWWTFQDDNWKNNSAAIAQRSGEIHNKEDDMPGMPTDKCNFTGWQYKVIEGAYQNAGLIAGDVVSTNLNLWGDQWVSATAFNIWDKNPWGQECRA